MTELQEFKAFFKRMGVKYSLETTTDMFVCNAHWYLSVTQNHFVFDADGNYLGSLADETPVYHEREG